MIARLLQNMWVLSLNREIDVTVKEVHQVCAVMISFVLIRARPKIFRNDVVILLSIFRQSQFSDQRRSIVKYLTLNFLPLMSITSDIKSFPPSGFMCVIV